MQDVRQTTDPPSDNLMSHSNQGGDRPFTPPTSISHFSPNEHPSILSGQGYFLTPASKPLYTSGSTSITQSNHCNLNGLASVHNYGPAYSTPYMSQNATSHTLASSPSPPVLPCPLPMFVNGGKSRYFDYYNPMTHANSSTESLLYTSDESHLHGHSQQTSEESALYGEHLSESKTAPCASSDVPWPSSTLASQAQTQFLPCQPSNASTGSTSMLLPSKGFFSEFATQHARFQESWPTQSSSLPSSSTVFPSSSDALTHQREDPERNFSRASQLRRVGSSHTSGEKSITSTSPHVSHSNYNMRALELPTFRSEREDTYYHTREDSSVSSSSASESISSASLIKQGKHDDGRPKRPLNAFMIFSKARRVALGKERPTLKGKDVSVALAEEWKNLEKTEKDHYQELARVVKDNFHKMYPTYVYSRRANGAKAKKSKASASFAPKSSSRRSANMGKPDSDDAIFSPEGYTSSASSTSSFAFRRRSSPLVPSGFHRPATGSNRDDRLISLGEAQNPTLSREVAPAFMPLQQQRLLPYPSVLLHPEEVNTFALPATGSSALAYHEIQATLSPNTVNFENFKSPSPRPRSDVSMTLRSDWSNEDSVTTPAVKPFGSRECTTSMISKTDISQGRADREQLGLALYQRLGYSSSPTMLSSNFDSPLQLPKPGTPPSFSLSQGTIHASTSTGYNADYNDCMKNVLARNQNGHILQDHRAYEPSFQPGTGLYSATSWSHDNVSPYQIHQEFDSTHTERLPNMRRHLPDSRASGFLPPTYGQDTEVTCVSSSPLPSLSYLNMTPSNTSQEGKTSEGKALSKIGE